MKTCGECKDEACPGVGGNHHDGPGCEDFTSEAIEEEPVEWTPTLEDYNQLKARYNDTTDYLDDALGRIANFENAVAELVKWAQAETP